VDRVRDRAAEDRHRQDPALQAAPERGRQLIGRRLATAALAVALALAGPGAPGPALGRSPLVAELETLAVRYNENPARLDAVRSGLAQAAPQEADPETWTALARVCFIWGDVRAASTEEKLAAYAEGKEAARHAIELAPRSAMAHLFYGINMGRWGQTRGVMRSLFLLPEMRETARRTLELDPRLPAAYALAGNLDYEVPGFLGGSLDAAERYFRKGLEVDPHFTPLRLGLAKVLRKRGRTAEARQELRAVLDEPAPANPAEWALQNVPEARALLGALGPEPARR
jgi:tetratricopeptide (TPR) repeat protein